MQWMSKPRWLASTGLLAALVSVAVVPAGPAAAAAIPGAAAPAPVTAISISQCVKSVGSDHLTVAQAERCTANAPVYASASPPKRPLTGAYVITKDGMAVIVRSVTNSARAVSSGSKVVPTGCWWSLTSGSVSWWGGDNGGSYTAWGDGNHCGYGDITATSPGPATVAWCVCTGMSWSMGSYDSNYGSSHFGYPYAAVWANGALSTGPVHWDNYIRLYHNSSGNWWSSISLG